MSIYPVDNIVYFADIYPLDSSLSTGYYLYFVSIQTDRPLALGFTYAVCSIKVLTYDITKDFCGLIVNSSKVWCSCCAIFKKSCLCQNKLNRTFSISWAFEPCLVHYIFKFSISTNYRHLNNITHNIIISML